MWPKLKNFSCPSDSGLKPHFHWHDQLCAREQVAYRETASRSLSRPRLETVRVADCAFAPPNIHMASSPDYTAYTEAVIAAIGPKASPRIRETFPIMLKHLHAAIVEADMSIEEWR